MGIGLPYALFTTVSGDELSASGKTVDGETAVVGAALTFCHAGGKFQGIYILNGKHGAVRRRQQGCPPVDGDPGRQSSEAAAHYIG